MTTVDEARATVKKLTARLGVVREREIELGKERQRLSFAAETGDQKARKALDAANAAHRRLRRDRTVSSTGRFDGSSMPTSPDYAYT